MNSFKDPEHLKAFCDAQNKTIIELSKRIQELEEENKQLKTGPKKELEIAPKFKEIIKLETSEQERICKIQLYMIQESACQRELTLEEARKVEIYSKILSSLDSRNKPLDVPFKKLTDEELIKELEQNGTEDK